MSPSFVVLSNYKNVKRTYARYAFTEDFAKAEAARMRDVPNIIKVVIQPYLGKTYFPEEKPADKKESK